MTKSMLSLSAVLFAAMTTLGCRATPVPVLHDGLDQVRYLRCVLRPNKEDVNSSNFVGEFGGYPPGSEVKVNMFSPQRVDLSINNIPHKMYPVEGEFNAGDIPGFLHKYFVNTKAEIGLEPQPAGGEAAADPMAGDQGNPLADPLATYPEDGTGSVEGDPATDPSLAGDSTVEEGSEAGFRLDLMKSSTASSVKQGIAAVGMTKAEVYMALGPPHYINFGTSATPLNMQTILDANRWVYYSSWFPKTFTFGLAGKRVYTFDGKNLVSVQ